MMTPDVRVLVVDDDPLVREALAMMLGGLEGIRVVGSVCDGSEVPEALARHATDVVLMDLRMPKVDGTTATARIRERPGAPEVLVLTTFDADTEVLGALHAGAVGYLLKDTPPQRIGEAVRQAAVGEAVLSPSIARRLMDRAVELATPTERARAELDRLTAREREVVTALARGGTNAEIAAALHLSEATVKAHVSRILETLDLGNRTQVALLAHDAGLA